MAQRNQSTVRLVAWGRWNGFYSYDRRLVGYHTTERRVGLIYEPGSSTLGRSQPLRRSVK
jgi:hypothetical protein